MKIKLPIFLVVLSMNLYGQSQLFMPKEIKKAYENKTRSFNGSPGENYWQNAVSYAIAAEIIPGSWKIKGDEKIVYTNHSPDSLKAIVIKTYPNHYKKGAARANQVPLETLTDGMILSNLAVDNVSVSLENVQNVRNYSTYTVIRLPKPAPPGTSITIDVQWTTEMPSTYVNRIGAYDANSCFVGYWYPQIGRYDDIDGWDRMEYMASQEFHTDFADFNVHIKVPGGYNVWGTGTLQNPDKVLTAEEFAQYTKAKSSQKGVTITPGAVSPIKSEGEEVWHYQATNVKDFAFGVSNTFKWISNAVNINSKVVLSNVVYDVTKNNVVERLLEVQAQSLQYLSTISPGISYPYPSFTTFLGVSEFDGMEFPMIANNGISDKEVENADVTFHELAHMYFPFFVGINEVKYSWMEEGWATFFTIKFIQSSFKGKEDENAELNRNLNSYNNSAGNMWDVPLITPSFLLTYGPAHSQLAYRKPAFMYFTLENLLGKETFDKCLKTYINRWSGKHPTPYDFMFTFNEISNQNLDWFWNAWVFQPGYGDLALTGLDKNTSKVNIKNIGRLPLPIHLELTYEDGSVQSIERTAEVWSQGDSSVTIKVENSKQLKSIQLITKHYPDADKTNNNLKL